MVNDVEVLPDLLAILACVGPGQEILLDAQVLEDAPALHDLDDAVLDDLGRALPVDRPPPELDPALRHLAALRSEQAGDGLERRRLARAVGAEEGDHRSEEHTSELQSL